MKGRAIVLDHLPNGAFAQALLVDGRLEDLIVTPDTATPDPMPGDIFSARVTRKLPKSGAFCALSSGVEGYLRDAKSVEQGANILVQVVNLPEAGKAVTLTTRLLFKGPRLILTPGTPGINVSRAIGNDAERTRLQSIVEGARVQTGAIDIGVILRTAARGEDANHLLGELECLEEAYQRAQSALDTTPLPTKRSEATKPKVGIPPDWLFPLADEIVGSPDAVSQLTAQDARPDPFWADDRFAGRLKSENDPLGSMGVLDEIDALRSPRSPLHSGGSMIVEPTRALVAVDVNTGSDFSAAAGLKANLAVAENLPRQMRLRGLGGQIVVDFAPMEKRHRRTLENALLKGFRADKIETSLVGWTKLGLFELQRKRERRPLGEVV